MSKTEKARKYRRELKDLSAGLPLKIIALPEFEESSYEPEKIRQKRKYLTGEESSQVIGRFLIERGVVDVLPQEKLLLLFAEMHWCAFQLTKLAQVKEDSEDRLYEMVVKARKLVSRMEAAEEELFISNRRLVVSCSKAYFWMGNVWLRDFLQEGSKILLNAMRKYDYTRGIPFYSYAKTAIQNRLRNYFRDHIRAGSVPFKPTQELTTLIDTIKDWRNEHDGEDPDLDTLILLTGLPKSRIEKLKSYLTLWQKNPVPISLDAPIGDGVTELYQLIEDPLSDRALIDAQNSEVWEAVDLLPERSASILRMRFLEGCTLEETGKRLSLTRARIKQIEDVSLMKLRQILRKGKYSSK